MRAPILYSSLLVLILILSPGVSAQDVEEIVKVDVALVTVNVLVTDNRGRPHSGLEAVDFQVSDQGKPMRVEFFDQKGPASIVFVIDLSSSMRHDKWRNLKAGMKKFLADAHSGNDYTLIGFSDKPRIIARAVKEAELWKVINEIDPAGNTALYDGVLLGLHVMREIPQRHKALVLISDGEDNSSLADLAAVRQQALMHNATFYTVGILNEQYLNRLRSGRTGKDLLTDLALATGGQSHFPAAHEVQRVFQEIRADLTSRYSLSYYPWEKTSGWRKVEVSLTPRPVRLKLRYQQRYLVR